MSSPPETITTVWAMAQDAQDGDGEADIEQVARQEKNTSGRSEPKISDQDHKRQQQARYCACRPGRRSATRSARASPTRTI